MKKSKNIFLKKNILIYGLGKSGVSSFKFLRKKSKVFLFDDYLKKDLRFGKKLISLKNINEIKFDIIIISPGIDILNCKLSDFLKKNVSKIYTDLDVFCSFFKNESITITGTNGKSTTAKILFDVLLDQKKDVRLIGNIGNPALNEKKITKKTIFVIEASSYQLDYSKIFSTKYAIILNIKPDHLERHKNLRNYIKAKFKLLESQNSRGFAYVNKNDKIINRKLKSKKFNSKIIKVDKTNINRFIKNITNDYFFTDTSKENLSFVIEISKKLKLKNHLLFNTIQNFKGLRYRQQVILKKNNLIIINDSKSTSFSSTVSILKTKSNIYWLLGGIYKKGDRLNLQRNEAPNVKAFIYGKNKKFFNKELKNKVSFKNFDNLDDGFKNIVNLIKKENLSYSTFLFSPCAASFDRFKNFEDRGIYFNKLVKKYYNE